jgi:hypothetical protein
MNPIRLLTALTLAVGLLATIDRSSAQSTKGDPPPVVVVRPDGTELPIVPRSSAAFISLKISDLFGQPELKAALEQFKKTPDALAGVTEMTGITPWDMERITLFWPSLQERRVGMPVMVITTTQPYNEARVLKALHAEPVLGARPRNGPAGPTFINPTFKSPSDIKEDGRATPPVKPPVEPKPFVEPPVGKHDGLAHTYISTTTQVDTDAPLFYSLNQLPFSILFLLDERTLVFLPPTMDAGLVTLVGQLLQKKPTGPLADAISTGGKHTLAAGVHLSPLLRQWDQRLDPELAPYSALLAARTAVVTGDLAQSAKLTLSLTFDDAAAARRAGPVLEEGLKTLSEKTATLVTDTKEGRNGRDRMLVPIFEAIGAGLKQAKVKVEGNSVAAATEMDIAPAVTRAAAEFLRASVARRRFAANTNNLKQIGLALITYCDANGKFPTNIYGPKGEPLLSWRVHLLPYLEQQNLYLKFKLDEPWNSPNNKPLIEMTPSVFELPDRPAPKGETYFQAFMTPLARDGLYPNGQSWLVDGGMVKITLATIPDGTSNTGGVFEARNPVVWSRPQDMILGDKLPPLGAEGADRFMVGMLDGSVRAVSTKIKPDVLRWLIDTRDGMVLPADTFLDDNGFGSAPPATGATAATKAEGPGTLQARLEKARATLREAEASMARCEIEYKRASELLRVGAISQADFDRAKAALATARAMAEECRAQVQSLQNALDAGKAPGPPTPEPLPGPKPPG